MTLKNNNMHKGSPLILQKIRNRVIIRCKNHSLLTLNLIMPDINIEYSMTFGKFKKTRTCDLS